MKKLFCICLVTLAVGCSPDKPIHGTVIGKYEETVHAGRLWTNLSSFITVVETNHYKVSSRQYINTQTGTVVYIERR